jgi:hypothetical protein
MTGILYAIKLFFFWIFHKSIKKYKKAVTLKIITNRFRSKFLTINFLQILILSKNEFFMSVLKGTKKNYIRALAHGLIS